MLRQLVAVGARLPTALVSAQRSEDELLFHGELSQMSRAYDHIDYYPVVEAPEATWTGARGRVSEALVTSLVSRYPGARFHLCGPAPMMDACRSMLVEAGVDPDQVRSESFKAALSERPSLESSATVRFARTGKTLVAPTGQTLLGLAQAQGVALHAACGAGQCGECKVRVLAGEVAAPSTDLLSPAELDEGYVLACQGLPAGTVVVDA